MGLTIIGYTEQFEWIINITGLRSSSLNRKSGFTSVYAFDMVRGSHIVPNRQLVCGCLLEALGERSVFLCCPIVERR